MSTVRRGTEGRVLFVVVLLGVIVAGLYVLGGPPGPSTPLDPRSTAPDGTKGLVLLLEQLGAEVDLSREVPVGGEADVVLVLQDTLDGGQHGDLQRWAEGGGRLVVADPTSPMTPLVTSDLPDLLADGTITPGTCDLDALDGLGDLAVPGAYRYETTGDESCYGSEDEAFVVAQRTGVGALVALAGAGGLTNEQLDEANNAPLAAALLAPTPGTRVRFLSPPAPGAAAGSGQEADADELVAPELRRAILQLAVAFLFFAAWRALRFGRPVVEAQPVQVEGSELVAAVGRLLQQNRSPQAAAEVLRRDLRRTLEERLGVPGDAPGEVAVELVAERTGLDRELVARGVAPTAVQDEAGLIEVAHSIEAIRAEVLHGQRP